MTDLRICFVGDSYTAGVGDPEGLGWVGRVARETLRRGRDLTFYNLGVRRDTSRDIQARFAGEIASRQAAGCDNRVVLSFGTNDTAPGEGEDGAERVPRVGTLAVLADLLEWTRRRGLPTLVVGPPALTDDSRNERLLGLTVLMRELTARRGVPFVPLTQAFAEDTRWRAELATGDGAHPRAVGYELLARRVLDSGWWDWLDSTAAPAAPAVVPGA
ncbi:GDSL-type esterase/lipase family protein [Actinopolymorpha rutila]|uniref:Lysophospholipase L1-like esterase n=1 Tax=Actinopolymorpha rutila TaxID=446787 RepID=A0A852Z8C7_9ACTN|nr:GDSL-type esterase/lipase family protein [Actinopolymorpha rutila]NYH89507.1 lysophospholipase L1-like esterase [Actinopolymorpha rutila]